MGEVGRQGSGEVGLMIASRTCWAEPGSPRRPAPDWWRCLLLIEVDDSLGMDCII